MIDLTVGDKHNYALITGVQVHGPLLKKKGAHIDFIYPGSNLELEICNFMLICGVCD